MNSKSKVLAIIGVVLVLAIGGVVAYAVMQKNKSQTDNNETSQSHMSDSTNRNHSDMKSDTKTEQANKVTITGYAYQPASIEVKVGTTVTWTNQDTVEHTVTTEDGAPASFDSGLFGKGESFSYTFKEPGQYDYLCTPHPYMKGTVTVTE